MKKLKTSEIVSVYQLLNLANLNGLDGAAKIAVVRTIKAMKPVAVEFDEFRKSALEKLKGENNEAMVELAQKWQSDENALTDEQKKEVNEYFMSYNKQVNECLIEEAGKEHEVDVKTLTGESFERIVGNNDWNAEQIMQMEVVLS